MPTKDVEQYPLSEAMIGFHYWMDSRNVHGDRCTRVGGYALVLVEKRRTDEVVCARVVNENNRFQRIGFSSESYPLGTVVFPAEDLDGRLIQPPADG